MSQFFAVHPDTPQPRLIRQAAEILRAGGVIAYPTDSCYALGCGLGDKQAMARIRQIRQFEAKHNFTLVCADLADLGTYARVENSTYRLLKRLTPGAYTFILDATREVPRRLQHPKRRTIGVRVPDNAVTHALLAELGEPIMSASLILPGEEFPPTDPYEIRQILEHQLDLVIDGGYCGMEPTTVIDLTGDQINVLRTGKGDVSGLD